MFVFDAASVHMLSMTTNEKATRAERICTARAKQMQIENYSCIVINSYSCDRVERNIPGIFLQVMEQKITNVIYVGIAPA